MSGSLQIYRKSLPVDWLASSVAESLICTPDQEDMNTNLGGTEIGKAILVGVTKLEVMLHFCNWR